MTIALNQLRFRSKVANMIRLNKLAHLLKAWRDSRAYRKLMMSNVIQVAHMRKTIN